MTMPVGLLRDDYVGNGAQKVYDFNFKIFKAADLQVIIADDLGVEFPVLTLGVDFSLAGVGESDGGQITLLDVGQDWLDAGGDLLTDYTITLLSARESEQDLSIRNQGPFYPEDIENEFDKQNILIKQLEEKVGRVIQLPATSPLNNVIIGPPTALYYLRWNAAGDAIEAVAAAGSTTPVSGETPTGLINNVNVTFNLANTPAAGTLRLYKNGLRTTDFSLAGAVITMNAAPNFGESLVADYEY